MPNLSWRSSGHVIGGSTVLVEAQGKRLFYTGDINLRGSRMLPKADLDIGDIDLLITESTYSQTNQTPRTESEQGLIEFANEVMDNKGILFVPSFSVERISRDCMRPKKCELPASSDYGRYGVKSK